MAKGQSFSRHQQGIVNRYYEHRDTIMVNKLGELVSDLYLADSAKKQDRLWERVKTALANLKVEEKHTTQIINNRDVAELAKLVAELTAGDTSSGRS